MKTAEPESMLPLTPAVLHILLSLSDGEKHGYAIMQEVDRQTEGAVKMGPGTLYGSLRRMKEGALIEESEERPDPDRVDVRRRYYEITEFGSRVLAAEVQRLQKVVQLPAVARILKGGA